MKKLTETKIEIVKAVYGTEDEKTGRCSFECERWQLVKDGVIIKEEIEPFFICYDENKSILNKISEVLRNIEHKPEKSLRTIRKQAKRLSQLPPPPEKTTQVFINNLIENLHCKNMKDVEGLEQKLIDAFKKVLESANTEAV